jgi:hypothetical protein
MPWVAWWQDDGRAGVDLEVLVVPPARAVAGPFPRYGDAMQALADYRKQRADELEAEKKQMRLWDETSDGTAEGVSDETDAA